jgi:flagellar hook-associated protein 2
MATSSVSSTASLLTSSTAAATTSSSASSSTSDIDWSGLIEEAVQAKMAKADSIDVKVTTNETKIAAYGSLQTLLATMTTAAQALRAPSGSSLASKDVFNSRTAYLTAVGSVDASSSVSATVESGAEIGSFDLAISQLARAHKVAGTTTSSKTTDLGYAGVISLGTDAAGPTDIAITATMSLAEVAEAINAKTSSSGVKASVLQVSSSQFQLILTSASTGQTITANAVPGDDMLANLGILDADGDFANELQASAQAIFSIDGIAVTRSTNDVSDVVDGVTLHLYQETPSGTSITVEVGTNLSTVKAAVVALVDAYNAYREFAYTQQQLPTDKTSSDSILFGDGTMRTISSNVASSLTTLIEKLSVSTIGLSFDENNYLVLDEDVLDDVLLTSLDDVKTLLSFQMSSSSSDIMMLGRGSASLGSFTLDVTVGPDGSLTSASVNGDASLWTVSGTRIIGAAGSKYEGFSLVYVGNSSQSIDLSLSTGIAELLYNTAKTASDINSGTLQTLMDSLSDYNDHLSAKSDDIRDRATTYQTNLTARYAKLQAAIAAAEASQDYLTTLLDTWNASS